jgi:SAC3 family protein LENG8/THP3
MYSAAPGAPPWQTSSFNGGGHTQPAYISVPARSTFTSNSHPPPPPSYAPPPAYTSSNYPPLPPPAASTSPAAKSKTNFSPEIRDYVQRSFADINFNPEISRQDIEVKLKQIITDATTNNRQYSTNWSTFPLPQQILFEERRQAALAPLPVSSYSSHFPTPHSAIVSPPKYESTVRKRKSGELSGEADHGDAPPPWRNGNKPTGSLADRVSFAPPDKRQKIEEHKSVSKSSNSLEQRKKRFEDLRSGSYSPNTPQTPRGLTPEPEPTGPIVGRSQKLEKNYFRLTSAPNPDDVRPLEVLRKTLELLKKKWRSDNNYTYICDQFKSLRQDLTVQHIQNDFTTTVYEIHARIALEKGDLGEYNQCQSQLRALHKQNLGGHPVEFKAYRILYFIHTCNRTDMNDVLSDLTPADKKEPAIKHALEVRSALALGNFHKFFRLYLSVPNMGAYLMDMFIERERLAALSSIGKA